MAGQLSLKTARDAIKYKKTEFFFVKTVYNWVFILKV